MTGTALSVTDEPNGYFEIMYAHERPLSRTAPTWNGNRMWFKWCENELNRVV